MYIDGNFNWNKEDLTTAIQMIILLSVAIGLFSLIIMYWRVWSRRFDQRYSECNAAFSINSRPLQSNSIYEPSVDRPPSYNEACAVPPPYQSPSNKICMLEPPVPETPHSSYSANQTFPAMNHI
ncbi:uncharacterized protein LOC122527884 [Frieseomelitta varia]|uniref:uncharacterized protein LOC122527884 n=1 Tax=Frieseomelitta varia TaxID=561572 RepID=UPI001CB67CD4|nr:uncharacterized protein LOC122527884 [Frieseomelitta varia]